MTDEKLKAKVEQLETRLDKVSKTNSEVRDELAELKRHYTNLIEGVNSRFQLFEKTFRKSVRKA